MKIVTKKTIKKECWNLDYEIIKWLNEHLKVFLKDASRVVDLKYHCFKYKNKTYTQEDVIKRLIEITDKLLCNSIEDYIDNKYEADKTEELDKLKNEMYDLMKAIHWSMWW